MIEIAVFLGFKRIYLLGADCNFVPNGQNHFIEHGQVDANISTAADRNINSYLAAKEYASKHGVTIVNATRGGKLEVFPRQNLEEILSLNG